MNNKFLKIKKGFSIIEVLVAMALIMIMTGVLLVSQSGNKAQKDAENAARQVAAQLRGLQSEALSGKQIGDSYVCFFTFTANANEAEYSIGYKDCPDGAKSLDSQTIKLNSGKGNTKFDDSGATVSFSVPHGAVAGSSQITLKSDNKSAYVCVCSSGNIFDTKGNCNCGS